MIKIENAEVTGWEAAIRGMRNPKNSWDKSDSVNCDSTPCSKCQYFVDSHCTSHHPGTTVTVGPNDLSLMRRLANAGPVEGKFRRMIVVYVDITAPFYWWKEFDTYKVGTVANSCSSFHMIQSKEFALEDFSHEHLLIVPKRELIFLIDMLNDERKAFLKTHDKVHWWQMIQLLPSSYNQRRTVMLNYEVLSNIYQHRRNHKLDEWREFCRWIETLPYAEIVTGGLPHEA